MRDSYGCRELLAQILDIVSGAIFPLTVLPGAVRVLAEFLPLSYWLELVRRSLLGEGTVKLYPALSRCRRGPTPRPHHRRTGRGGPGGVCGCGPARAPLRLHRHRGSSELQPAGWTGLRPTSAPAAGQCRSTRARRL